MEGEGMCVQPQSVKGGSAFCFWRVLHVNQALEHQGSESARHGGGPYVLD